MRMTRYSGHHVLVYTPTYYRAIGSDSEHKEMMRRSKELAAQVDRHCDGEGKAEIHFETEHYCSHCGYGWEVDDDGIPVCCDKAQNEILSTGDSGK